MMIVPDRQFASYEAVASIMPVMFGGREGFESWGYLMGESRFGTHAVRLTWRPRELAIETTDKWVDFLGFVFHFFK